MVQREDCELDKEDRSQRSGNAWADGGLHIGGGGDELNRDAAPPFGACRSRQETSG